MMRHVVKQTVTIQPGGLVQVQSPELLPGCKAEVLVIQEESVSPPRPLPALIGAAAGGFASPSDVEAFLRRERDAWES